MVEICAVPYLTGSCSLCPLPDSHLLYELGPKVYTIARLLQKKKKGQVMKNTKYEKSKGEEHLL